MKFIFVLMLSVVVMSGCASRSTPEAVYAGPTYDTPEATFQTWRHAAEKLDLQTLVNTYASAARGQMMKELENTEPPALKAMQAETLKTKFEVQKIVYEGARAYVRIMRTFEGQQEVEVLNMIRESEGWKILP